MSKPNKVHEERILAARRKRRKRILELREQYKEYAVIIVNLQHELASTVSRYTANLVAQELHTAELTMQAIKDELAAYNLRDIA